MTEKDLKHLSRRELIDIIYQMKKHELELQARLDEAEKQLQDRTICISRAGSIAEAALQINGIFEAAEAAARDYLQSIKTLTNQK